ncbi:DedA family protein [Cryobacterium aureum]|uniref:DedA family protein n=1 Tax=Cryobacterium aureum TaxID=995037 RepID=UPI000CF4E89B|nr:DedA family protein [Cryobacterium aureum]
MQGLIDSITDWLESLSQFAGGGLDTIQAIDPLLRTLIAGTATALEMFIVTGLFVPGDTIVLLAAASAGSPAASVVLGIVVAIGSLLGEVAGYLLGRWAGGTRWGERLSRRFDHGRLASAGTFLSERGGPAILAARFMPVFRTVMPFVVGLSGFPFRRFLAWATPASVAWSATYVTLYWFAAAPLRDGTGSVVLTASLVLLGLLLFAASASLQHVVAPKRPRHSNPPTPPIQGLL